MPRPIKPKLPPYTRQHSNGGYQIRYPLYKTLEGKWQYEIQTHHTLEATWETYRQLETKYAHHKPTSEGEKTIAVHLALYITGKAIQPTTRAEYERLAEKLNEHIGSIPVRKLTTDDVYLAVEKLTSNRKNREVEPASHRTKNMALDLISGMLGNLRMRKIIPDDPTYGLTLPKQTKKHHGRVIPFDQLHAFLREMAPTRHYPLFATLAALGLRPGEGQALHLDDLERKDGHLLIHVRHTIQMQNAGTIIADRTKTPSGLRMVVAPPDLAELLEDWLERRAKELPEFGYVSNLLHPTTNGQPHLYTNLRKYLEAARTAASVPHFTLMDFRRTWAAVARKRGVERELRMVWMGHSSTAEQHDVYAARVEMAELYPVAELMAGLLPVVPREVLGSAVKRKGARTDLKGKK